MTTTEIIISLLSTILAGLTTGGVWVYLKLQKHSANLSSIQQHVVGGPVVRHLPVATPEAINQK